MDLHRTWHSSPVLGVEGRVLDGSVVGAQGVGPDPVEGHVSVRGDGGEPALNNQKLFLDMHNLVALHLLIYRLLIWSKVNVNTYKLFIHPHNLKFAFQNLVKKSIVCFGGGNLR